MTETLSTEPVVKYRIVIAHDHMPNEIVLTFTNDLDQSMIKQLAEDINLSNDIEYIYCERDTWAGWRRF